MAKLENVKILDMVNGEPTRVEYNGAIYEKTEEKAQAGDLVRVIDAEEIIDVTQGGFYEMDDDTTFYDDDDCMRDYAVNDHALETFRKASADLAERLAELERRLEALEERAAAKVESAPKFKVGDYVKLSIEDGKRPRFGWGGAKNGDIGKIAEIFNDGTLKIDFPNHEGWNGVIHEIVPVTDEEVAQAKAKMQPKFEVGDYVVPLSEADEAYSITNTNMKLGKITHVYSDVDIRVEIIAHENNAKIGEDYRVEPKYFRKATTEEIEKAEEAARWAKIGRKPGEFKKGDIVRVVDKGTSNLQVGEIGELGEDNGRGSFRVNGRLKTVNWIGGHNGGEFELIVPVEQRFDIAAEAASQ
jgi:Mind bomb SH3 repeat domain